MWASTISALTRAYALIGKPPKGAKVEDFIGGHAGIIGSQVHALEETKEPIRKSIAATIAKKHRVREIDSDHKRTV
jgi:hypothetical protein